MNLLVIGQSVVDIITYAGRVEKKPGGIHYSILALNSIVQSIDKVFLCSSLSKKDEYIFEETYSQIDRRYIKCVDEIPTVNLTIQDNNEREEIYSNIARGLKVLYDDLNMFDAIYINMITGYDLTPEQLVQIRQNYKGLIYFDVHTLSRGIDEDMKRNFRPIQDFNNWAKHISILQANEKEIKTVSEKTEEIDIINEMFDYGIEIIIVTRAEKGVTAYTGSKGNIESVFLPAINLNTINKVGCGDVFGAVFFYNYISQKNVNDSLMLANIAAGISTTYSNNIDYINLKRDVFKRYSKEQDPDRRR